MAVRHQVLLRDVLPEPEQLVNFSSAGLLQGNVTCDFIADCEAVFSYPMFRDHQRSQTFGMEAYGHIPHLPGSRIGPGDHKESPLIQDGFSTEFLTASVTMWCNRTFSKQHYGEYQRIAPIFRSLRDHAKELNVQLLARRVRCYFDVVAG